MNLLEVLDKEYVLAIVLIQLENFQCNIEKYPEQTVGYYAPAEDYFFMKQSGKSVKDTQVCKGVALIHIVLITSDSLTKNAKPSTVTV